MSTDNALLDEIAPSLFAGNYSLLTGAGVSLDSRNGTCDSLMSGGQYLNYFAKLKTVDPKYGLQDIFDMLQPKEVEAHVTRKFEKCMAGPTTRLLTKFIWNQIYTFNIDDAIEAAYEIKDDRPQQSIDVVHFRDQYRDNKNRDIVQLVHLHGTTRRAVDGYVFSKNQYVRLMKDPNPWMLILGDQIASDPFIIAGTSLNEIDLEYYLSLRSGETATSARGPSLLIEPFADNMTEHKCKKHGLILIKDTLDGFLSSIVKRFPSIPRRDSFINVKMATAFDPPPKPKELNHFSEQFEIVERQTPGPGITTTRFFHGAQPTWLDLERKLDVVRSSLPHLTKYLQDFWQGKIDDEIVIVTDVAGGGKTTAVRRVAYDAAISGMLVVNQIAYGRPDVDNFVKLASSCKSKMIIFIDDAGDACGWIADALPRLPAGKCLFVLSERSYRRAHIERILSAARKSEYRHPKGVEAEYRKLLDSYISRGRVADPNALKQPGVFARKISGEPFALAACQILNEFRTVDEIAKGLLQASTIEQRKSYFLVGLGTYCYHSGLRFLFASKASSPKAISSLLVSELPLSLIGSTVEGVLYVRPASRILSERVLSVAKRNYYSELKDSFFLLGKALAPFVTRETIKRGTPEARASQRLFDWDQAVSEFIGPDAHAFYDEMQTAWQWNSRFWEQKALLCLSEHQKLGKHRAPSSFLTDAIDHARHAVAVERHPYPLNTLGIVLTAALDVNGYGAQTVFDEAFASFADAIRFEAGSARISIYPFLGIMKLVDRFLALGGELIEEQRSKVSEYCDSAVRKFPKDDDIIRAAAALRRVRR